MTNSAEQRAVRFARQIGVELELLSSSSGHGIHAFEQMTGIELTDLPGMEADGFWLSWRASFDGLQQFVDETLRAYSMPGGSRGAATVQWEFKHLKQLSSR